MGLFYADCLASLALALFLPLLALEGSAKNFPGNQSPDILDSTNILRIRVDISEADVARLNGASRSRLQGGPYVRPSGTATVREGNRVYTNVSIHLKGTSSFRPIGHKPALTLNFSKFAPEQTFHGLRQISLNNSAQDPTYLSERICRELFEAAGVPVPRTTYAVLTLNGRNQGLYVLAEAYDKRFLRRYFNDVTGNLYEGGVLTDVSERMDVNSGSDPKDQSDLKTFLSAVTHATQSKQLDKLTAVLDVERFTSMIAMEIMLCHCDSYAMNRNNYRLYHDRDSDRMIFMPHGMDRTFGIGNRCPVDIPLWPALKGSVASALLATAEGNERYLSRLAELNATLFDLERIEQRALTLTEQIRPVLEEVAPAARPRHEAEVHRLLENIAARKFFVSRALTECGRRLAFDTTGCAKLDNWSATPRQTNPTSEGSFPGDDRPALRLVSSPEAGTVSWRAKAILLPGRYRFEGRVKTRGVPEHPDYGARLMMSGRPVKPSLNGDGDWEQLWCSFTVRGSPAELEFICELKSPEGEAWFDLDSLLVRCR